MTTSCTDDYGELTAESGPLSDIDQAQQDDEGFVEEEDDHDSCFCGCCASYRNRIRGYNLQFMCICFI